MGILSWFAELGSELVSAEYNWERDLANVDYDPTRLRPDQKINILLRYLDLEEISELSEEQVDHILTSAMRGI